MNLFTRFSSSLARVLILPFVVLILVLSLLVGLLSYLAGKHAVVEVAQQMLERTSERVAVTVEHHVAGAAAALEAAFPRGLSATADFNNELDVLRARFWVATSLHPDLDNYVYYGNRRGDFVGLYRAAANAGELRVKRGSDNFRSAYSCDSIASLLGMPKIDSTDFDPRVRPWYTAAEHSNQDTWSQIYINYWEKDLVATRVRRVLADNGEFEGVVATDISLHALNDFVRQIHVSAHGMVFVMEANGQLVASSADDSVFTMQNGQMVRLSAANSSAPIIRIAYAALQKRLDPASGSNKETHFVFNDSDGEPVYASYAWIRDDAGLAWLSVVAVPRGDFLKTLDANARWTVLIVVVAITLALLLGVSVVHWVVRDVRRLSRAATRLGKGQMNVSLKIERRDEIGQLASNFMAMQSELNTDKLTGVTSRAALLRYLDAAVHRRDRRQAERFEKFTVIFIDLNRFKAINDTLGHEYGDLALIEVGQRLRTIMREDDVVARFGGDEFVLVFWSVADPVFADKLRVKIEQVLAPRLLCLQGVPNGAGMTVGASVGVAFYPQDGQDAETLIKRADHGMYQDKAAGRNGSGPGPGAAGSAPR